MVSKGVAESTEVFRVHRIRHMGLDDGKDMLEELPHFGARGIVRNETDHRQSLEEGEDDGRIFLAVVEDLIESEIEFLLHAVGGIDDLHISVFPRSDEVIFRGKELS